MYKILFEKDLLNVIMNFYYCSVRICPPPTFNIICYLRFACAILSISVVVGHYEVLVLQIVCCGYFNRS